MGNLTTDLEVEEIDFEEDRWLSEADDKEEDGCPVVRISKEDYADMCHPKKQALVVLVLG